MRFKSQTYDQSQTYDILTQSYSINWNYKNKKLRQERQVEKNSKSKLRFESNL